MQNCLTSSCAPPSLLAFAFPADVVARASWRPRRARVGGAAATATTEPWGLTWCGAFGLAFAAALARVGAGVPTLAGLRGSTGCFVGIGMLLCI